MSMIGFIYFYLIPNVYQITALALMFDLTTPADNKVTVLAYQHNFCRPLAF